MYKVKIYGAGSIGNHLAHAARSLGWHVTVCDVDSDALHRMQHDIYPARYGSWDDEIDLRLNSNAPQGGADLICIGTPPEYHLPLAIEASKEEPKAILIEKPACPPSLDMAAKVKEIAGESQGRTRWFVGYDHVVGRATRQVEELLVDEVLGRVMSIDVAFREHWAGIFDAHPWLDSPEDTYLGYWRRGGGASGEHSHAVNLWQHFAHVARGERVESVQAVLRYQSDGEAVYDDLCSMLLRTHGGLAGTVVQDVFSIPSTKRAAIRCEKGTIEWRCGHSEQGDAVLLRRKGGDIECIDIPKTRPDDFIEELKHIESRLIEPSLFSPINLDRGLDTMMVVAAAHLSQETGRRVEINYDAGYSLESLIT